MSNDKVYHTAKVIFKKNAWTVSVDDKKLGRASSLMSATDLLYTSGYKVYAYRRGASPGGKIMFTADCLKFDYDKENV